MPKKKVIAAAAILVALVFLIAAVSLAAAAFSKIYYLRQYAGGSLVWHSDEAYLFLFESRVGYRIPLRRVPVGALGRVPHAFRKERSDKQTGAAQNLDRRAAPQPAFRKDLVLRRNPRLRQPDGV